MPDKYNLGETNQDQTKDQWVKDQFDCRNVIILSQDTQATQATQAT